MTRHFRKLTDLSREELHGVIDRGIALKRMRGTKQHPQPLVGKTIALIFEKASTRTRISFEVGVHELGGNALAMTAEQTQLGRGEPLEDTARMLSGYTHGVVYRTFGQDKIERLARASSVPVINGLSDQYHPCQLLADLMTMKEVFGRLAGLKVAWVGDGNNMAHSFMLAAGLCDLDLRLACPRGYQPQPAVHTEFEALGRGKVLLTEDPDEAVRDADVVTTDVWASMGQESEARARTEAFRGFIVDPARMERADPKAIFLHCLPAHRGEEVAAEVIDGPQSRVFPQAENRLHSQKALLELLYA